MQRYEWQSDRISAHRTAVYKLERQHPEHWSRNIRNWHLPEWVVLNTSSKASNDNLLMHFIFSL